MLLSKSLSRQAAKSCRPAAVCQSQTVLSRVPVFREHHQRASRRVSLTTRAADTAEAPTEAPTETAPVEPALPDGPKVLVDVCCRL